MSYRERDDGGCGQNGAMIGDSYEFQAELWAWAARKELWVFAALPQDASDEIADQPRAPSGFGSVRVQVRLGLST